MAFVNVRVGLWATGAGRRTACTLRQGRCEAVRQPGVRGVRAEAAGSDDVYEEAGVGEMGFKPATTGDQIDQTNRSFGSLNRLTELDRLLGSTCVIEKGGKEGPLNCFYRSAGPTDGEAVLLIHGLPSSSYSYRGVIAQLAERGYFAVAPDLIGFGFSDKPQPGYGFDYTSAAYSTVMDSFLDAVGVDSFTIVVNGWFAPWALRYALGAGDRVRSIIILNSALPPMNPKLPLTMKRWGWPGFLGDGFCQDPMSVERALEGGGPYYLDLRDADVYRRPYMLSGDAGFALGGAVRNLDLDNAFEAVRTGFEEFDKPVYMAWGESDKYLTTDVATEFKDKVYPRTQISFLSNVGHYAAEDYPERVTEQILNFLKRTAD